MQPKNSKSGFAARPFHEMTTEQLAYLAGIIDGEGCIQLNRYPPKKRYKTRIYQVAVTITNTDKRLIDWLEGNIGGYVYKVAKNGKRQSPKKHVYWHFTISTMHAAAVLRKIRPYLVTKQDQADIAIEFQDHIQKCKTAGYKRVGLKKGRPVLSDAVIDYRESMYKKLIHSRHNGMTPMDMF